MKSELITNEILCHGMGSKILKVINLIGYSDLLKTKGYNVDFIYTPLDYETNEKNFIFNELQSYHFEKVIDPRKEYLDVCRRWENFLKYKGKTILENKNENIKSLIHPNLFGENERETFNHTRNIKNKIKELFNLPKKTYHNKKKISVHIRRGDVNPYVHPDRWLSDDYYLNVLNKIKKVYSEDLEITIYTQKLGFNYDLFKDYKIIYDDEKPDNEVWSELINSDILVIGKSAFSYSAGILNDGLVIYPEDGMFHIKLKDWKTISEL